MPPPGDSSQPFYPQTLGWSPLHPLISGHVNSLNHPKNVAFSRRIASAAWFSLPPGTLYFSSSTCLCLTLSSLSTFLNPQKAGKSWNQLDPRNLYKTHENTRGCARNVLNGVVAFGEWKTAFFARPSIFETAHSIGSPMHAWHFFPTRRCFAFKKKAPWLPGIYPKIGCCRGRINGW